MSLTTFPPLRDKETAATVPAVALALVLFYAALAVVLGAAVIAVTVDDLTGPTLLLVAACAVTACAVERISRRSGEVLAKNAAPIVYLGAALILPPPAPILIAVVAIAVCHLTWSGMSVVSRLAAIAHTTVVVTLMTVLTYSAFGEERLIRAVMAMVASPGHPAHLGLHAPLRADAASAALPTTLTLAALVLAYYVLDTVPLTVFGALLRRVAPLSAWRDLYGRTLPVDLAVPCIASLAAVMYRASAFHPAAVLLLPPALTVYWALEHVRATPRDVGESAEQRPVQDDETRLGAVLSAVRALGGNGDLGEVTRTLARAAVQLTRFRSCVAYLYDARDGMFLPHAASDERKMDAWIEVPREDAESLMATANMLGYSYYARAQRDETVLPGRWQAGDTLVVPLLLKTGDVIGFLQLDAPSDGCAPTATDLPPIETVAMLGAGVIARLRHTDEALHLAQTDGLTGLLNRRAFEDRLDAELQGHLFRRPVALMMIDLDDFGSINNTYGHQIGDDALRLVAGVVRSHLRQSDAGGRYGGDEFVVILPGLDADGAMEVAERVRLALVDATTRAAAEGRLPQMYTSIGVAVFPHDAASPAALVKAADDALYSSKRLGKNRVSLRGAA